jgi:hypothetical protein
MRPEKIRVWRKTERHKRGSHRAEPASRILAAIGRARQAAEVITPATSEAELAEWAAMRAGRAYERAASAQPCQWRTVAPLPPAAEVGAAQFLLASALDTGDLGSIATALDNLYEASERETLASVLTADGERLVPA